MSYSICIDAECDLYARARHYPANPTTAMITHCFTYHILCIVIIKILLVWTELSHTHMLPNRTLLVVLLQDNKLNAKILCFKITLPAF